MDYYGAIMPVIPKRHSRISFGKSPKPCDHDWRIVKGIKYDLHQCKKCGQIKEMPKEFTK